MLLMAAIRNVHIVSVNWEILFPIHDYATRHQFSFVPFQARPTMYQIVKEMIDKMGYAVSLCFFLYYFT